MDISVVILGILDLRFGDIACVPSAPKPKKVLALLLIYRNQIVPVSALVEELWGNRPPASARTTLQTYILTLRKLLQAAAPSAGELLVTAGPGYMLRIPDDAVDLHRFGRLAKQGREAISRGTTRRAWCSSRRPSTSTADRCSRMWTRANPSPPT